jgi:hypothetical protein
MAQHALGNIQPASTTTALQATNNAQTLLSQPPASAYSCQAIQFQALSTNTGSVFIVDRAVPDLTMNVLAEIPAPSSSPATRPAWVIGDPSKPAAYNAATFWILPAVSGEGVRVTVVR